MASIDIRSGRLTREEGVALEQEYDGKRPASMDWFLEILGMSEAEFYEILKPLEVFPWSFDVQAVEGGRELYDFSQWDNTDLSDVPLGDTSLFTKRFRIAMIAIIDYGMGNVRSIRNALLFLGEEAEGYLGQKS